MARFPCSVGDHFNRLRNCHAYVAWGSGADFTRTRLRLCPFHFSLFQENLAQFECPPVDDAIPADWVPNSNCVTCFQPVGEIGWQVFVTSYPPNNERKDYWGKLHIDCALPKNLTAQV
jgi:hypothetical protein